MIKFIKDELILDFISWLNRHYGIEEPVYLTILHEVLMIPMTKSEAVDYSLTNEAELYGFATYNRKTRIITMVSQAPPSIKKLDGESEFLCHILAHEYCHHLQHYSKDKKRMTNQKKETLAEEFAYRVVEEYFNDFEDEDDE